MILVHTNWRKHTLIYNISHHTQSHFLLKSADTLGWYVWDYFTFEWGPLNKCITFRPYVEQYNWIYRRYIMTHKVTGSIKINGQDIMFMFVRFSTYIYTICKTGVWKNIKTYICKIWYENLQQWKYQNRLIF